MQTELGAVWARDGDLAFAVKYGPFRVESAIHTRLQQKEKVECYAIP